MANNYSDSSSFDSSFNYITLPINWSLGHAVASCADASDLYGESILIRANNNNHIVWAVSAQNMTHISSTWVQNIQFIGVGY